MKILGISGSPRQGGNTETLVRAVLEGAAARGCDTELVSLGGLLLIGGLIALALQRRKEYRARQDSPQEDFVSFYDKENRVE